MWIMTVDGFYSAVQHRQHPDLVIVRARDYDDLVRLVDKTIPGVVPHTIIEETPKADYPCRVTVHSSLWQHYVTKAAAEIDYDNFKSAVTKRQGSDRSHVYHAVWAVLHRLEDEPLPLPSWSRSEPAWAEPLDAEEIDVFESLHRIPLSKPLPLDT